MNLRFSILFAVIALAGIAPQCFGQADVRGGFRPFDHDQYSGKAIVSQNTAMDLIDHREMNAPLVGEVAPEFSLQRLGSGEMADLASLHREKPVVLIFASESCQIFAQTYQRLIRVHSRFKDDVNFAMIYIREAHPPTEVSDLQESVDQVARLRAAESCLTDRKLPFPVLLDKMEDTVATRWAAWPIRLFVVDTEGVVKYAGPSGPWGFRPTSDFQHGDGEFGGWDLRFNRESLEEFLAEMLDQKTE